MRIVVDLTPILPGGENGGAKPMVLALMCHLPALAPDWEFILLTAERSHDELAFLDRNNVSRLCIIKNSVAQPAPTQTKLLWKTHLYQFLIRLLPERFFRYVKRIYQRLRFWKTGYLGLLLSLKADLLFNPFTAPTYYDDTVPTVSIVYDLQFMDYPQFFSAQDRFYRQRHFGSAASLSDHVVTISDFVRQSVLANSELLPQQVTSLPIGLVRPMHVPLEKQAKILLENLGLKEKNFLLYPANFWLHKNHEMLLVAFLRYKRQNPASDLKLVCTGALQERRALLSKFAMRMGLGDAVVFPGFLSDDDLAALYQSAMALIFPSLYEGFGIPVLEAMAADIPVLCSRVTSLPEVAGDAAVYFHPGSPQQIADAIKRVADDATYRQELTAKGRAQLAKFGGAEELAEKYYHVLRQAINGKREVKMYILEGISDDGAVLSRGVSLSYPRAEQGMKRKWTLTATLPAWFPTSASVQLLASDNERLASLEIAPGESKEVSCFLPQEAGRLRCISQPSFSQSFVGVGADTREITLFCDDSKIHFNTHILSLRDKSHVPIH